MTDVKSAAQKLLDLARELERGIERNDSLFNATHTIVSNILMLAWVESVRRGYDEQLSEGIYDTKKRVAKAITRNSGHDRDDYVCMPYPLQPMICKVDGKNVVCLEAIMQGAVPLWVHYFPKVDEALEIAEMVSTCPGGRLYVL